MNYHYAIVLEYDGEIYPDSGMVTHPADPAGVRDFIRTVVTARADFPADCTVRTFMLIAGGKDVTP